MNSSPETEPSAAPFKLNLSVGNGGWVHVEYKVPLYVRLTRSAGGRWQVTQLYLGGGEQISGEAVRGLPIARIEAAAAHPSIASALEARKNRPAVPLDVLASHYDHNFVKNRNWVAAAYFSHFPDSGVERVGVKKHEFRDLTEFEEPPPPLNAPAGRRLTDEFLRQVAVAYAWASAHDEWPAPAIAKQAGVSVHAARKWIYTARKRGIMRSGEQGKVG